MSKTIEKYGRLILSDKEYAVMIEILSSLPDDAVCLSDLLNLKYQEPFYIVPAKVIQLLSAKEKKGAKREWQEVLSKFNKFAEENLISM